MQVVCPTIARAVAHLEKAKDSAIAEALIKILKDNADDEYEIDMFYENGEISKMVFKSVHDVEYEIDLGEVVVFVSTEDTETTANVRSVTGFVQDVAGQTVYLDGKPIKEFGQKPVTPNTDPKSNPSNSSTETESKTMNTNNTQSTSSTQQAAAPQQPAPATDNNELALKIGKGVLYVAGAGAAIAAGVWAWKKWGSSTTTTTV